MSDTKIIGWKTEGSGIGGMIWVVGWLFTIGYLHLHVVKAVFALVIWPFYLGSALGK